MTLARLGHTRLAIAIALIVALAIVSSLAWAFGQQLSLARQVRVEEKRLEHVVATQRALNDDLTERLEYVRSDEYVEYWARTEARMARPGEVAVIPLQDAATEPTGGAQPTPAPESKARPFWVELWELVFGSAEQP